MLGQRSSFPRPYLFKQFWSELERRRALLIHASWQKCNSLCRLYVTCAVGVQLNRRTVRTEWRWPGNRRLNLKWRMKSQRPLHALSSGYKAYALEVCKAIFGIHLIGFSFLQWRWFGSYPSERILAELNLFLPRTR